MIDGDQIKRGAKMIRDGMACFDGGPFDYHLDCLLAARTLLLERFAPFKVGDRVKIAKPINFDNAPGWHCCRHFLVVGAEGVVRSSEVRPDATLTFHVEFASESWIDDQGNVRPISDKHVYCFGERSLELA